jgi:hypothetical protein
MDDAVDIRYEYIYEKYQRRVMWFNENVVKGKKCLFVRFQTHMHHLKECGELTDCLKRFNPENKMWIISSEQSDEVMREDLNDNAVVWRISQKSDYLYDSRSHDWMGNFTHWNKLFSGVYMKSTMGMKRWFEERMKTFIQNAKASGRDVVFWGESDAQKMLPYFLNGGIVPKVFDNRKVNAAPHYLYEGSEDELLSKKYFIVVASYYGREDILEKIAGAGLEEGLDYGRLPKEWWHMVSANNI